MAENDLRAALDCQFGPPAEPFGCAVHHGVRLRLTDMQCNRAPGGGLPCGFRYPTYRCNMPESVHRGEHPFQPYDRRVGERRHAHPVPDTGAVLDVAHVLDLLERGKSFSARAYLRAALSATTKEEKG